jgi:hypothetical protein
MLTVTKTGDDGNTTELPYELPGSATGEVIVRVVDTDRSRNENSTDTIFIDHMYIRVENSGPVLPEVTIEATDSTVAENPVDTGEFTVTRTGDLIGDLVVSYDASAGTATAGDYVALSGSVTIPDGQSTATITVTPIDDSDIDPGETVILTVTGGAGYTVGSPDSDTVTIADDEIGPPEVTIVATDPNAAEAALDPGVFTVTRTGATSGDLVVNYTLGGTATEGSDFDTLPGSVTISIGQSIAFITITPKEDALDDPDETVIVTLSAAAAYTVGSPSNDTVTIADNDGGDPPTEQFFFATTETTNAGTVIVGSLTDTIVGDNEHEVIEERESSGKPSNRHSFLDHKWTIPGVSGDTVTFSVEAHRNFLVEETDFFQFSWSTDDATYVNMFTVTKTSDDDGVQSFVLNPTPSGTVYIRVQDTDQSNGNKSLDRLFIDRMYIVSTSIPLPASVSRAFPTISRSVSEPIPSVAGDSSDGTDDAQVGSAVLLDNFTTLVQETFSDSNQDDLSSGQRAVVSVYEFSSVNEPIMEQTEDEESAHSESDLLTSSASSHQIDSVITELLEEGIVPTL